MTDQKEQYRYEEIEAYAIGVKHAVNKLMEIVKLHKGALKTKNTAQRIRQERIAVDMIINRTQQLKYILNQEEGT